MLRRESTNHTVAWFVDQNRLGKLNLDPPYQRKDMVWSKDYKEYFIDTILRNYPSPAIFLHVVISPDGYTMYNVVDGKQRLCAMFEYVKGEFIITEKYGDPSYAGKEFNDLEGEFKTHFWEYILPVQEVYGASEEELRSALDRLNRNVAKLSNQELRHAKLPGKFADLMENLVEEPFWGDIGISTRSSARRMRDVEFVAEIFLLTMHGIQDGTQASILDNYYQKYDVEIPNQEEHLRQYRSCMRILENIGVLSIKNSRYSNISDFYSLWAACLEYTQNPERVDSVKTLKALQEFEALLSVYIQNPDPVNLEANPNLITYYDNVRQGVNKATNRENRARVLASLIRIQE